MADRFPLIANSSANQIQELAASDQLNLTGSNLIFGDSSDGSSDDVLSFGASGDLKIFHQADQSRIVESGPSVLKIMGSDVRISNAGNTADYIQCNDGSNVKLYFNGGEKLATTNTGVNVTGAITVNGSALTSKLIDYKMKEYGRNRYQIGNVGNWAEMDNNFRLTHTPAAVGNTIICTFHIQYNLSNGTYGGMSLVTDQGSSSDEAMLGASTSGSNGVPKGSILSAGNLNESIRNNSGNTNWEFMQGWGYHIAENTNSHTFKLYARLGNGDYYIGDNQFAQTMQLWEYQGNCVSSQIIT